MKQNEENLLTLRRGSVVFEPTPEQAQAIADYRIEAKTKGWKDSVSQLTTGFVYPHQIKRYWCEKCLESYYGNPKIQISIDDIPPTRNVAHLCPQGHFVLHDFLPEGSVVPEEFIVFDATGDHKRPTPDAIEKLVGKLEEVAKQGNFDKRTVDILTKWAGKINYPLDQARIETAKATAKKVYLKNFADNLPENLREIQELGFGFNLCESDSVTHFEGTGLSYKVEELLRNLPEIDLPEDPQVRTDLERVLGLNREMYADEFRRVKREREEYLKRVEAKLDGLRKELRDAHQHEQRFLEKLKK